MSVLSLPLRVKVSRTKHFIINMNNYRNTHYIILNRAKVVFKELMRKTITKLPVFNRIKLIYTLYPATLHQMDVSNVCAVMDKFFADALVELGKLTDDNYNYVPSVSFEFGSIDKVNPRVEVQIIELNETLKEQDQMQITLDDNQVFSMLNNGQTVRIEITAVANQNAAVATQNTGSKLNIETIQNPVQKTESVQSESEVEQAPAQEVQPEPVKGIQVVRKGGGLFANKVTPKPEAQPEATTPEPEAPTANISSGEEDRVDPEDEQVEEEIQEKEVKEEAQPNPEPAPAPTKPKFLFNFKKPDQA